MAAGPRTLTDVTGMAEFASTINGNRAAVLTLAPPFRKQNDSLLCVIASCGSRATTTTVLRIGGQDRRVHVCVRHGRP